jgi:glycosyltransferase involved in cell wall biosynthesis
MRTILVSAYGCEPLKGSEPAVGWNWVLELAKKNIVHVITRANNQEVIEKYMPKDLEGRLFFHYYDAPDFIRKMKKKDKGLYFYYFFWQIGILKLAKSIIRQKGVDFTIHLTFGSMWMPTFLPLLNTRFIWGPIGGGESVPLSFMSVMPFKQRALQFFRYILNWSTIINPFILLPAIRAEQILARTPNTKSILPFFVKKKTKVLLETAMEESIFAREKQNYAADEISMFVSARFISIKNIPTVIRSLKYIQTTKKWSLTLLGSGPDENLIKSIIKSEKCEDKIRLIPFLPREEALDCITKSDIFIFPSLKEGGTWALMEAMAMGVPVVCVNWAGMAVETDESSAIRLEVTSPKVMEREMGEAITRLINSQELRERIGVAGRMRIKEVFNWQAKADFIEDLFDDLDSQK